MQVFDLNPDSPEVDLTKEIAALLGQGKVVAYPTDTLYALGADAFNHDAVHRIAILKGRDGTKPFPCIIDTVERLQKWGIELSPVAGAIADNFWPGPVSLVVKGPIGLPGYVLNEKGAICLRVPESKIARSIARNIGGLLVATSANPSGCPPSRSAQEAIDYFRGEIDAVIDGGRSTKDSPSTILDVSEGKLVIIREGAVPSEEILSALARVQKRLGT
jgi:L-threonylcarbamoyladenylate synthase